MTNTLTIQRYFISKTNDFIDFYESNHNTIASTVIVIFESTKLFFTAKKILSNQDYNLKQKTIRIIISLRSVIGAFILKALHDDDPLFLVALFTDFMFFKSLQLLVSILRWEISTWHFR